MSNLVAYIRLFNYCSDRNFTLKFIQQEVKTSDYCEYIRPPIDKYKTLQFGSFDQIREVGYQHGKTYFEGQLSAGNLPVFKAATMTNKSESDHILSDYTFTDLAQMVCKVSRPYEDSSSPNSSDDEYEDGQSGYASEPTVCLTEVSAKS